MVLMYCHNYKVLNNKQNISDYRGFGMKIKTQAVFENQDVIMQCDSLSTIQWLKDDAHWPSRPSHFYHRYKRAIILDEAKQHDSGTYTCVGSYRDDDGQEKRMSSTSVLYVGGIIHCCC